MSDFFFGLPLFDDFERLQRQMTNLLTGAPVSIRAGRFGAFPPINLGSTDDSVEIVAFAPGIDPAKLEVTVDKGLLTINGEREAAPEAEGESRSYARERFTGSFRRAVELPRDADPDNVRARYVNGCLIVTVGKRESSKPRSIAIQ